MNKENTFMKIEIKLKSFDAYLIDDAAKKVVLLAKSEKATISGPIPLPTHREIITILRSVHVNKKSREQFESRTHKRLIVLTKVSATLVDKMKRLELPAGVQINIKSVNTK
ncbi:30S ribosomal protein S10 [Metamycoplasma hyosynoviae]|uniref:Small ribosomal subunit protein uS10 n=2 Tax=Metamycoplasma hyosynoviae TaxID=29559 RepID=A0A9Q9BUZ9_9BACT|nr:30S ribosomal protein S10 [Metamycoplasma hyosynoviae]MDC8900332.1 30S ribosomal protein S10 [Metamycoplasma hyosynoviae]MDC8901220.1 30S ribosomal protein S10 [Metamycoplasma hyosynoviae]MDC8911764.1 30S ribosomal protein S10 [Metamycoplasma hyosynoviae]MDC8912649.1 30S ribosomal protein S10 [Metamycoplasma hyosynoviae]MDC8912978.1 30S ribosomal protein S10 [Metamycoplasma hyosynoviae]